MKNNINRYSEKKHLCAICNNIKEYSFIQYMGSSFNQNYFFMCKNESNHICLDCLNKFFAKCVSCKKYHLNCMTKNIELNNEQHHKICLNCSNNVELYSCNKCKKLFMFKPYFKGYCKACAKNMFVLCKQCNTTVDKEQSFKGYCINCVNTFDFIKNYSYKPTPIFHKTNQNESLFMGVEIELTTKKSKIDVKKFCIETKNDFIYFKKDASIGLNGLEIVSHPASYEYHIKSRVWDKVLQKAFKYELKGHRTTGLHIHMNRSFFTPKEISLIDKFINCEANFWKDISGRINKGYNFCQFVNKREDKWGKYTANRYCALNLSNPKTIELRIFQGTNNIKKFFFYLMICDALGKFVKTINKVNNNTLNLFKKFIKINYGVTI